MDIIWSHLLHKMAGVRSLWWWWWWGNFYVWMSLGCRNSSGNICSTSCLRWIWGSKDHSNLQECSGIPGNHRSCRFSGRSRYLRQGVLFICLYVRLFVCLSVCIHICVYVCLPVHLFVFFCLSLYIQLYVSYARMHVLYVVCCLSLVPWWTVSLWLPFNLFMYICVSVYLAVHLSGCVFVCLVVLLDVCLIVNMCVHLCVHHCVLSVCWYHMVWYVSVSVCCLLRSCWLIACCRT